jgi:hypothetical protein
MKDTAAPQGNTNKQAAPQILVPFTRAAHEHIEPMSDVTQAMTSNSTALGPYDVPAYGYLRGIWLDVQFTGGAGGGAVTKEDSPWSAISEIALIDVNGAPIVGPFSGYDLFLINKYGGYAYGSDPRLSPIYTALDANGNGRFLLRVPVEFSAREGLGALPNANAASTWKLRVTIAPSNQVFSTAPATLPNVRTRMYLDAWSQPAQTDLKGNATAQQPPAIGTTSYWSKTTLPVSSGFNTLRLPRMGSLLRNLIFVFRDTAAGTRAGGDTQFADTPSLYWDTRLLKTYQKDLWRHEMYRKTGYSAALEAANGLDKGVFVEDYAHDFDGRIGGELRDQYIGTTQSTRYELTGNFLAAGTMTVITNDVAAASEIFVS